MRRLLPAFAFLWTIGAGIYLLCAPTYEGVRSENTLGTTISAVTGSTRADATLLAIEGPTALIPLALPVLLALVPLLVSSRRRTIAAGTAGLLLGAFSLLGAMTIGFYYLPAALLLLLGAIIPEPTPHSA